MNIKKISIMLGGVFPGELPSSDLWCGVDRGAFYLLDKGINPLLSCGDFDSINTEQRKEVEEKSKYFRVKDSEDLTDADFALENILELFDSIEEIDIYGATGRRLDHFFGNILLLNNEKYNNVKISIIDDNNIITIAHSGHNIFKKIEEYKYFSIVPIYKDTKMTIKNSKYEVENLILTLNRPNATSNEFANGKAIELEVSSNVLVIYSKD
ncbi:thiamine diphosphokinase [Gemella haemolysans]|uniref:thiamine diphosphokinase n=1 Tax=Gemella haemolysans TaxID=1379 RepID=UPI0019576BE4|nr:thiamine diphosphokinase [Gemella haemolysans]VTX58365.1 Thiamine pyrophosphokinase [Gemella haemolysans]